MSVYENVICWNIQEIWKPCSSTILVTIKCQVQEIMSHSLSGEECHVFGRQHHLVLHLEFVILHTVPTCLSIDLNELSSAKKKGPKILSYIDPHQMLTVSNRLSSPVGFLYIIQLGCAC